MRTSIYLPDALAEQVKAYEISISEVAQAALQVAVERAQLQEKVMSDIAAVAKRLQSGITKIMQIKYAAGRDAGIEWAKRYASLENLKVMSGETEEFWHHDSDLIDLIAEKYDSDPNMAYDESMDDDEIRAMYDAYEQGFVKGAAEVWEAVKPLLNWQVL